jgi:hypothetical protein
MGAKVAGVRGYYKIAITLRHMGSYSLFMFAVSLPNALPLCSSCLETRPINNLRCIAVSQTALTRFQILTVGCVADESDSGPLIRELLCSAEWLWTTSFTPRVKRLGSGLKHLEPTTGVPCLQSGGRACRISSGN